MIFPFAREDDVKNLTATLNLQNCTEESLAVLNEWVDRNSFPSGDIPKNLTKILCRRPHSAGVFIKIEKSECLTDKEHARNEAKLFLEHRKVVKELVDFLVQKSQELRILREEQAEMMRRIFWQTDFECSNFFGSTSIFFIDRLESIYRTEEMTRTSTLLLLSCLVFYVSSDQIVVGAFQKIFPYATAATVKTLTTNVNKQTTKPKAKTVVTNWVPKNWKAASATVDSSNQLSKQAYAKNKALTFIDMRYSLTKYINYLYNQAISTKYLTKAEATNMRTMFWAADTSTSNNYTATCQTFMAEASTKIQKTPTIVSKVQELTGTFASANPTDYSNLQWSL
ncbi:unnamed protein product [Caenorhabditis sp. 36 PRJEB53466]|nr:unnamed protein product [Caenorhabditis sp. 36 PRJEB53466]